MVLCTMVYNIIVFRFVYTRTHERGCYIGTAVVVVGGEDLPVGTAP